MGSLPLDIAALPERPLVSVLMPVYNYAAYVREALDSLVAQSYIHFEGLICDDGSTDASPEMVADYAQRDVRLRLFLQENGGVASALNKAYAASQGEVIVLLDADDRFAPDKLERVVACLRSRAGVGLVGHAMGVIDHKGQPTGVLPVKGAFEEGWIAEQVRARGGRWRSMPASALAFHRDVAECLFPIPEPLFRSEADGYLSTLAALFTRVAFLPERLADYRLHGANLTGALRLDRAALVRGIDALHRKNEAINQRLTAFGHAAGHLALEDHLNLHEQLFTMALFDGRPRRELLRSYRLLVRALLADDLYRPVRKAAGVMAYGGGALLPTALRPKWLAMILGARGLRRWVHPKT